MPQTRTIKEVISHLDAIIEWCISNEHRAGYFAALYRCMTIGVQQSMTQQNFGDAARMEKLNVIFANRYLEAWDCFRQQKQCSLSWQTAFEASTQYKMAVIQHLLLGINTHINLDLAIAAAETAPGAAIEDLQSDFEAINIVIASLTGKVYDRLCRIWFPLRLLGRITANSHEAVVNFSIGKARAASWSNALLLAHCGPGHAQQKCIDVIDGGVNKIAGGIINPGKAASMLLKTVQWMEPAQPSQIIKLLNDIA